MRLTSPLLAAALIAGLAPFATASAAPMQPPIGVTAGSDSLVQDVPWRRGPGWRGGYGYRGYGYGGGYGYRGYGPGAGVVTGLAVGALLGGALAAPPPPQYVVPGDADAYCFSRFKSYDPASGTYLGFDGYRHPCP